MKQPWLAMQKEKAHGHIEEQNLYLFHLTYCGCYYQPYFKYQACQTQISNNNVLSQKLYEHLKPCLTYYTVVESKVWKVMEVL